MEKPLVDKTYIVEKFPGKGGWTFVALPEIQPDKKSYFNWIQVRGSIDGYALNHYRLMPMGGGKMFMPLKAEVRKHIKKGEGDSVHVILYKDDTPFVIPDEFLVCLTESPQAELFFNTLTISNQRFYVDWIYSAKRLETKVNRIAKTIERLEKKEKFFDVPKEHLLN